MLIQGFFFLANIYNIATLFLYKYTNIENIASIYRKHIDNIATL